MPNLVKEIWIEHMSIGMIVISKLMQVLCLMIQIRMLNWTMCSIGYRERALSCKAFQLCRDRILWRPHSVRQIKILINRKYLIIQDQLESKNQEWCAPDPVDASANRMISRTIRTKTAFYMEITVQKNFKRQLFLKMVLIRRVSRKMNSKLKLST